MAILSTLLSATVPHGMWESIIWAFEGATKNYVWAVVLLTVIIRLIWAPLDLYNRRISMKNAQMQAKMQPELEKIQQKYGNDKQMLNQKTNELYKRNNFNVMGSCGFMLVFMVLNLVIFFTLFGGLNNIAGYKIYTNYENLKENYANTLYLTNQKDGENIRLFKEKFDAATEVEFRLFENADGKQIGLFKKSAEQTDEGSAIYFGKYLTIKEFEDLDTLDEENKKDKLNANDILLPIIDSFKENILKTIPAENEEAEATKITLLEEVTEAAMPLIENQYNATKESFLWIGNIWIADSPFKTTIFSYREFASNARGRVYEGEETVYNAFMGNLSKTQTRVNGYFILPILTLAVSFLSMWLSQRLMTGKKSKDAKAPKQGKIMQIVMPLIMALFAILYNSVFAIYMLTSQIISTALLPLQQLILNKMANHAEKKKLQAANTETDYRRKN